MSSEITQNKTLFTKKYFNGHKYEKAKGLSIV